MFWRYCENSTILSLSVLVVSESCHVLIQHLIYCIPLFIMLYSLETNVHECDQEGDTVLVIHVIHAGFPDPPLNLAHDISANTETSTVIQWQAPLYTGGDGISSMEYTVTVGNQTWSVPVSDDDSDMFIHTITGLHYNTDYSVSVTAINSCGMESKPASVTVNIEARG